MLSGQGRASIFPGNAHSSHAHAKMYEVRHGGRMRRGRSQVSCAPAGCFLVNRASDANCGERRAKGRGCALPVPLPTQPPSIGLWLRPGIFLGRPPTAARVIGERVNWVGVFSWAPTTFVLHLTPSNSTIQRQDEYPPSATGSRRKPTSR